MSMVQFNLLPDVKLQYIRVQRTKNLVYTVATLVSVISLALFLIALVSVDILQKSELNSAGTSVDKASSQLKSISQVNNIITIQNQLKSLTSLHQNKNITSRIFTYLPQVTPANVSINKLDLDLTKGTMDISGTANSQADVNTFVDTLKYATYKVASTDTPKAAFPSVVESGFSITPNNISYSISVQYDPKLFANNLLDSQGKAQTPTLTVQKSSAAAQLNPSSTLFNSTQTGAGGQ